MCSEIFKNAITLGEYVRGLTREPHPPHLSTALRDVLTTAMIIPEESIPFIPARDPSDPVSPVREILHRFIASQIKQHKEFRKTNCLCLGYRCKNMFSRSEVKGSLNIECVFVNTLHSLVTTPQWQELNGYVGEMGLVAILSRPVFLPSSAGSFLQVSGESSAEMIRQITALQRNKRDPFVQRISAHIVAPAPGPVVENMVSGRTVLPRHAIFYSMRFESKAGLPNKHVLNKVSNDWINIYLLYCVVYRLQWLISWFRSLPRPSLCREICLVAL